MTNKNDTGKRTTTKVASDMVSPFRDKLWQLFRRTAPGMDGADAIVALKQAGEEIWAAGIEDQITRAPAYHCRINRLGPEINYGRGIADPRFFLAAQSGGAN